jgi:hypothetical protein
VVAVAFKLRTDCPAGAGGPVGAGGVEEGGESERLGVELVEAGDGAAVVEGPARCPGTVPGNLRVNNCRL